MNIIHKGASIFYTDQGSGSPVILLHGFLENHTMWDPFLKQLTLDHRIICIDLLGHGNTECTGYVHTMEDMAMAVNAVVTHLKIMDVQIIGHSMGGYVGLAFAKAYSDRTKALCLLNSTPEVDGEERKELRVRAIEMAKKQYQQLIRMSFVNLFDPESKKQHNDAIQDALQQALQTPLQGFIAAHEGMRIRKEHIDFFKKATFYTGMILGTKDWIINADQHIKSYKPYINSIELIESGHMSHISNQEKTSNYLLSFLTKDKE